MAYASEDRGSTHCNLDITQLAKPQSLAQIYTLLPNQTVEHLLSEGKHRIRLDCLAHESMLFSFDQTSMEKLSVVSSDNKVERLAATQPAFLVPPAVKLVEFEVNMHSASTITFAWQHIALANKHSLLNNITMSGFYGLCLALILYVFLMGQKIGEPSFQLYSIYVFCAATFFLLQEGQLNIIMPQYAFILSHYFYLLFAAFTVVSATIFIVNITEIKSRWPKLTQFILYPMALCVLFIACMILIIDHALISPILHYAMGYITFSIMLMVLALVAMQTINKVKMSWLVLLSLISMVVAMFIRLFTYDTDPFLQRYALIIAFAFEAFIFAIVVSSRIKLIKQGKLLAENEANTDSLCEVLNRRGWVQHATALLNRQKQEGGLISLLYIDLDDFKLINDTHGHECGDKVLRIITKIIRNQVRSDDLIGRVGGDEFVVIGLFESEQEPMQIAQRLKQRLALQTLQLNDGGSIEMGASVGHIMTDEVDTITDILSQADQSMYTVKRDKGKQTVSYQL